MGGAIERARPNEILQQNAHTVGEVTSGFWDASSVSFLNIKFSNVQATGYNMKIVMFFLVQRNAKE